MKLRDRTWRTSRFFRGYGAPGLLTTRMFRRHPLHGFLLVSCEPGTDTCERIPFMLQAPSLSTRLRHASTSVTLLLFAMQVGPLVLGFWCGWTWAVAGWLGVGILLTYCTLTPHSRLFGAAIRRLPSVQRSLVLTIDDGPCADTEQMLQILAG